MDKTFHKAAVKCIKNAYKLSEAAKLLKNNGLTGPAISLLVLACEEVGKGIHYRSFAEGYSTTDIKKMGETYVFSQNILYNHKIKQLDAISPYMIRLLDDLMQRRGEEIEKISENVKVEDLVAGKIDPEITKKLIDLVDSDPKFNEKSKKLKDIFDNMEVLKERGFYVGIKKGEVQTPEDLTAEEYNRLLRIFDDLVVSYSDRVLGIIPGRGEEFHQMVMKNLAKMQTRPAFSRLDRKNRRGK